MMKARFFGTPAKLRAWFDEHHETAKELWVGFHKRATGRPSVTWSESVDEALCVGWIDGVRKRIDEHSYKIRFTPRKPTSTWSAINMGKVAALKKAGRMRPAGLKAHEARRPNKVGIYAYEQRSPELDEPYRSLLRRNKAAWEFFEAQPPSYRKVMGWYIHSAKKEETRLARVEKLEAASARGKRL
jgi:uncharacterized protein YdeI (YjbR/CyaY-like superfamily)